jgi:tocopherol cyclase
MRTPAAWFRGVRHPEAFHGVGVTKEFFEGWYIKLVSADLSQRWAVIPGIFRGLGSASGTDTRDEAFVQVLDGASGRAWYHRYDVSEFEASDDHFEVRVGPNRFSATGVHLETPQLTGDITFTTALDPWPVTLGSPGAMGWYGHVPFMECFHAVVSFGHGLDGVLEVEGEKQSFDAGRGYIEKDWGKAFPDAYVWLASNHIDTTPDASLMGSVAVIPWLGGAFRGFLVGLKHGGRLYRWSTYNRAREVRLEVDDTHVRWSLTGRDGTLELEATRVRGGLLMAPQRHAMLERVEETLDARVHVKHTDTRGRLLLEGTALATGLEVVGDIDRLTGLKTK